VAREGLGRVGGWNFARRGEAEVVDNFFRPLGRGVKLSNRIDVVAHKLSPHGSVGVNRQDIDDAADPGRHPSRGRGPGRRAGRRKVAVLEAAGRVIAERGALDFWRVRMRPGHPVAFGMIGEMPILALPGNPVAAFVTFHVLARPAIARMLGQTPELPPTVPARRRPTPCTTCRNGASSLSVPGRPSTKA